MAHCSVSTCISTEPMVRHSRGKDLCAHTLLNHKFILISV